jgi:PAS domain S-box-containing protein
MNRPDSAKPDIVSKFSTACSFLACGFGLLVLAGWAFHVKAFRTIIPGQVAVKANTGVCFVLIGFTLWLLQRRDERQRWEKGIALGLSVIVGIVAFLSFLECWHGWDLRIDQILFAAGADDLPGSVRPGLMSPITAADFFLLSPAVFLLAFRKRWADIASQVLTLCTAVLSMFGILDFVLDANSSHTYISPITALVLLLFSFGVLLSRTESGLSALIASPTSAGRLARRLFPTAIALPIGIAWLRWHLQAGGYFSAWSGLALMTVGSVVLLWTVTAWTVAATERATAEELNARESARRLASIVNSSIDAIIGKALDGTITGWNPAAETIYGYKASEVVGRSISLLIPPDRAEELRQIMECVQRGEAVRPFETVRIHKDGHAIHVSLSIGPIKDEKGRVVGASAIFRDVTERKLTSEALQLERQRFRDVLDKLPAYVVLLTPDYHVALDNTVFRQFFGEHRGRTCHEISLWADHSVRGL